MGNRFGLYRNAALLFALWLLLSGRFEPFFIGLGLLSAAGIAWLQARHPGPPNPTIPFFRFMPYLAWLFYRILMSNLHMVRLILARRILIAPRLIYYRTKLSNPAAVALLANSITLTPGTVTAEVTPPLLLVHALDEASAEDLTSGRLEDRIGRIFPRGEDAP